MNVRGEPCIGFCGDAADFLEVGHSVGGTLPAAYIEFIQAADGGHPENGCFYIPGDDPSNYAVINRFYSFADERIENIRSAISRWGKTLGPRALPIAKDGGGNQFYLNLSDSIPSVWLYLHDEGGARILLSRSFEEFISGLAPIPDQS
jgi:hypothetical protein